jgi:hypothetical protein
VLCICCKATHEIKLCSPIFFKRILVELCRHVRYLTLNGILGQLYCELYSIGRIEQPCFSPSLLALLL